MNFVVRLAVTKNLTAVGSRPDTLQAKALTPHYDFVCFFQSGCKDTKKCENGTLFPRKVS